MSRPTTIRRTADEAAVWRVFTDVGRAGYQAVGICSNPNCETAGLTTVAGKSPRARVCVTCFEFEFGCVHPSAARIEGLRS